MFEVIRVLPTIVLASIVFRAVSGSPENPSSRGWFAAILAGAVFLSGTGALQKIWLGLIGAG
jgi:hypothetical protein